MTAGRAHGNWSAIMTSMLADPPAGAALSAEEIQQFRENGYLGPLTLCSPDEMAAYREQMEREVMDPSTCERRDWGHNRHLDNRLIYDLSTAPPILQRMKSLYGEDLLLWRTNFFIKEEGGKEIPWHQDFNYWPLEPPIIISAWIAVDQATVENACVQVIPGSHRRVVPHIKADEGMAFAEMAHPDYYDSSELVNLEMKPGEFILFNERTLHHSEPNRSTKRRAGLAVRVIVPIVQVLWFDSDDHELMVISGRDCMGFNPVCAPPAP
jgi:hypothetical protein